ncbi:hypothetical protein OHB12_31930 [Nocardia sp. NBC_01730]|uniref:hypothetical protein n=1 Tax=Nocardia sp. NBC_01730 TaxID=2975998 RepID=UPI002E11A092|nr:hypothetical protein OHB12_31930 [Nocardia sp. NBC_01730]
MTDPLDMDEPHEVVASSDKHTIAMTNVGGHVERITRDFVVPKPPQSKVERPLAVFTDWMKTAIEGKVKANGRDADATTHHTRAVSNALAHQDRAGGSHIHRAESL